MALDESRGLVGQTARRTLADTILALSAQIDLAEKQLECSAPEKESDGPTMDKVDNLTRVVDGMVARMRRINSALEGI